MIDRTTGCIQISLCDKPLRPGMRLEEFLASSPQRLRQRWDPKQTTYVVGPKTIGDVNFYITLFFRCEFLHRVELGYTCYQPRLSWMDRLEILIGRPRVPSTDESLTVCARWLSDNLGQETQSQTYPWGIVSLVHDRARVGVYIQIEYFDTPLSDWKT
jgi:hypothetical protein